MEKRLPEIIGPKMFLFLGLIDILAGLIIFFKLSTVELAFDSLLIFIGSLVFTLLVFLISIKLGLVAVVLIAILNTINIPFAKFVGLVILFKGLGTFLHYLQVRYQKQK